MKIRYVKDSKNRYVKETIDLRRNRNAKVVPIEEEKAQEGPVTRQAEPSGSGESYSAKKGRSDQYSGNRSSSIDDGALNTALVISLYTSNMDNSCW